MLNVANFVFVNLLQDISCFVVADSFENIGKVQTVVQVGLFKRQAQSRNEVHRRLHRFDDAPKLTTDWKAPKLDATLFHAVDVHSSMFLLFLQRYQDALAKRVRGIGKFEQHQRHQLGGKQFMISQKMQQLPTGLLILQKFVAGRLGP